METEREMKQNYCCICGRKFLSNESRVNGELKGTFQCMPCTDVIERKELLLNREPAYISFIQKWDKIPGRIRIEIPFKSKAYIEAGVNYHVVIWRD